MGSIIISRYLIIGIILSFIFILKNIIIDIYEVEILNEDYFTFDMLVNDIGEGLIIGLAWGISILIICLTNLIISGKDIIVELFNKGGNE